VDGLSWCERKIEKNRVKFVILIFFFCIKNIFFTNSFVVGEFFVFILCFGECDMIQLS